MRRTLLAPLFLLCAAGLARADNGPTDPGAPWPTNVDMPRATAMGGAHAAIATGNDALTVNPAGIGQGHRYHFEIDGVYDSKFPAQGVMVSVVDTLSAGVASGILWSRWGSGQPDSRGEGWYLGLSYSGTTGSLYYGGTTKYLRFHGPDGLNTAWAQDFGVLSRRGNFAWALVVQNVALSKVPLFPVLGTAAVAWGTDTDWHLSFDYKADFGDTSNVKHKFALGGELLVEDSIALRGGTTWDKSAGQWFATAGIAFLTEKGGLQFVWRRRISGPYDQLFEGGLTIYLE